MAVKIQFSSPRGVLRSFSRPGILDKMSFALVLPWLLKQAKESDKGTDLDREESLRLKERRAGLWLGKPPRGPSIPTVPTCLLQEDKLHRLTLSSSYFYLPSEDTPILFLLPLCVWTENSCQHICSTSQRAQDMRLVLQEILVAQSSCTALFRSLCCRGAEEEGST